MSLTILNFAKLKSKYLKKHNFYKICIMLQQSILNVYRCTLETSIMQVNGDYATIVKSHDLNFFLHL